MIPKIESRVQTSYTVFIFSLLLALIFVPTVLQAKDTPTFNEAEVCDKSSSLIIATDAGSVDISSLNISMVKEIGSDTDPSDSVIDILSETCGYISIVSMDGFGIVLGQENSSDEIDGLNYGGETDSELSLDNTLLESCNYDAVVVEIINNDHCTKKNGTPWVERNGTPWVELNGTPWVERRGTPWVELNGTPWVELNGTPWVELNGTPWVELNGTPWVERNGTPWVERNGTPWVERNGTPWVELRGTPWVELNGTPWVELRGTPWVELKGTPWVEFRGTPWVELRGEVGTVRIVGLSETEGDVESSLNLNAFPFKTLK